MGRLRNTLAAAAVGAALTAPAASAAQWNPSAIGGAERRRAGATGQPGGARGGPSRGRRDARRAARRTGKAGKQRRYLSWLLESEANEATSASRTAPGRRLRTGAAEPIRNL